MSILVQTLCILLSLCLSLNTLANEVKVFVSIPPQKFVVDKIGGDTVDVQIMLQPGHSPELYEPLPKQLITLGTADVYFQIGVPFEKQLQNLLKQRDNLKLVECCQSLMVNNHDDPHIWTSPHNMILHAQVVRDNLQELNPVRSELYENNFIELEAELKSLQMFISKTLQPLSKKSFFVVHPSWGYFAEEYGLKQHALEKGHGHVGSRGLVKLIELAKQEKVSILFSQKQYHLASAKAFAREINAEVVSLDPLASDYINNMQYVAEQLARALQ